MKMIAAILAITLLLGGCTSRTEYGECIGAFDEKKPELTYKVSVWNTFLAIIFIETIIIPIWVIADEALCPIGKNSHGSP